MNLIGQDQFETSDLIIKFKVKNIIQIFCLLLIITDLVGIFCFNRVLFQSSALYFWWTTSIFITSIVLSVIIFLSAYFKLKNKISLILGILLLNIHIFNMMIYLLEIVYENFVIIIILNSILPIIISFNILLLLWFPYLFKSKKNLIIAKLKDTLVKLSGLVISIWAYLPIMAGILTPMFIYFPIAYSSWQILTFIISENNYYIYLNSWFEIYPWDVSLIFNLIFIEAVIFLIGFGIFLSGLITLIKGRMTRDNLIQKGLYRFIRHPQNLGIIIFSISFILYIPGLGDLGIRIADFISWILFSMIIVVISDLEEIRMKRKYMQEYSEYIEKTGFFMPKILKHRKKLIKNIKVRYIIRYVLMIIIFIFIVNITNLIAKYLYINNIVEIYR